MEIKKVAVVPEKDLEALTTLYYNAFKGYMKLDSPQPDDETNSFIKYHFTSQSLCHLIAYHEDTPVGFLSYGRITPRLMGLYAGVIDFLRSHNTLFDFLTDANTVESKLLQHKRTLTSLYTVVKRHLEGDPKINNSIDDFKRDSRIVYVLDGLGSITYVANYDLMKYATAVHPEMMQQGIASALNQRLEEEAKRDSRIAHIFTICHKASDMILVNNLSGYDSLLEITAWYKDGGAALFMGKKVQTAVYD